MERKKILILGANDKQVQLIRAAKEEGYYVIVCDYDSNRPGVKIADKQYPVNYMDQEAVLSAAKQEQIDGVIGNNDPAMPIVAYVAEQLGLVGNKKSSIEKLVSKSSFRELQEKSGVYCPKHIEVDDFSDVEEAIKEFDDPIVVKPSLCAASQGTTKCLKNQTEKIHEAFEICKGFSRNGMVTIEEFVTMPSLEVIEGDIFVVGDKILWNGIFTTCRSRMAPMIPMTYIFPAILTQDELDLIKTTITKLFKEAGIRHGQYNVEMYFTAKKELFVIEVNPRQGGHLIPQWILEHTGIDFTKLLVTTTIGDTEYLNSIKDIKPSKNYQTHHVIFSDCGGVFEKLEIKPAIKDYVTDVVLHKKIGDHVNPRFFAKDRKIAYVTLEFPDRETQLAFTGEKLEQLIYPVVSEKELPLADCSLPYQPIFDFMTGDAYDFFVPKLLRVPRTVEGYAEQLSAYCTIVYDVDENQHIIGMAAGYTHNLRIPQHALIAEVYVNSDHRGEGLGERLVNRFIEYSKSIGMKGVWLHVYKDNYKAQKFYQKLGFVIDESTKEDRLIVMNLTF